MESLSYTQWHYVCNAASPVVSLVSARRPDQSSLDTWLKVHRCCSCILGSLLILLCPPCPENLLMSLDLEG